MLHKVKELGMLLFLFAKFGCGETPPDVHDAYDANGEDARDADLPLPEADTEKDEDGEPAAMFADIQWHLNEQIGSLVHLSWTQGQEADVLVEYSFDTDQWHQSPADHRDPGRQEALLLGIPFGTPFVFRLVVIGGELTSQQVEGQTGPVPSAMPLPEVMVGGEQGWERGSEHLLGSVNASMGHWTRGDFWMFVIDRRGRAVWAMPTQAPRWTYFVRLSADGKDILWDESTYWSNFDDGAGSLIHRMKIDGTVVATYPAPGLHHAFVDLPDGTLVWGAASGESETLEEMSPEGERRTIFDCEEFHRALGVDDWCQSNTIFWNGSADTFLYSFFTTHAVIEVDHGSGEVLRSFGGLPGSFGFDPEDSTFWLQHGAALTSSGTLLLSSHSAEEATEGCMREYAIDDEASMLRQVWSYGVGGGEEAPYAGEAHRLPSGNTLQNFGTNPMVREVTDDGTVVWEVRWPAGGEQGRLIGRTTFVPDLYALAP